MPAAAPKKRSAAEVARRHTAILSAAHKRIDDHLEQRLADLIQPILERAGNQAASAFQRRATNHMTAALLRERDRDALMRIPPGVFPGGIGYRLRPFIVAAAQEIDSTSTMIAVKPRPDEAAALTSPGGVAAEDLHVTLCYLGEIDGDLTDIVDALKAVAASHAPLEGVVGGVGRFIPPGVAILLPDVPGLVELRVAVTEALQAEGVSYSRDHGFEAHITIDAAPDPDTLEEALRLTPQKPLHFDSILVVRGDRLEAELPLIGPPPLTAAANPPPWSSPAGDEILNVDALVQTLRTKTDPVRQAVVKAAMEPGLNDAKLSFDVTNPLTKKVLAQAGSQVRGIAETTQLNVMRIIDRAYSEGFSIPDTAKAIRAGMASASAWRARTIARTELAAAASGGSLAASQLASGALGITMYKVWNTAPGAPHPRHEDYDGLDGQTVGLEDGFDVGGDTLQFPGDPDGDPGETINCFPAETLVQWPRLRAATRRRYEGDLVRIRTAAGDELAGTPNHPVLRADGQWVPLGEVQEGDDLIRADLSWQPSGAPDPDRPPAAISEVYGLAGMAADPERVRLAPPDLHGDGTHGEIDVVAINGSLLIDRESASDKQIEEFGFAVAERARARQGGRNHARVGDSLGRDLSASFASASFVGMERESPALVCVQSRHPESVGLRSGAQRKAEQLQPAADDTAILAQGFADSENGVTILVAATKIIEVDRVPHSGDVFTLDTGEGWFTAGNLLVRNCRCALSYTETPPSGDGVVDTGSPGGGLTEGSSDAGARALDDVLPVTPPPGDTISVGTGEPVPQAMVARIQTLGLDRPLSELTPTTDAGRDVFAKAPTTEGLFKPGGHYLPDGSYTGGAWTEDRTALHDNIIARHFEGRTPPALAEGEKPTAIFTAGGSASGKGGTMIEIGDRSFPLSDLEKDAERIAAGEAPKYPDVILMNPDIIKEMLPEYETLRDSSDLYAASGVHEESSEIGKVVQKLATERGYNVVIDTTGSSGTFTAKIEAMVRQGYDTKVRMVSIPTNTAIERAMVRGDGSGRYVSIQALKGAHRGASAQLDVWKDNSLISDWKLYDNTENRVLVAEGGQGKFVVHDQAKWDEILAKQSEHAAAPNTAVGKAATKAPPPPLATTTPLTPSVATIIPGPSKAVQAAVRLKYDTMLAHWRSWAKATGADYEAVLQDAQTNLSDRVADAPVQVRVTPSTLQAIVGDGRFKSQFETNTSAGALNPEARARAERNLFGYKANLPEDQRPIYGYLGGSASEVSGPVTQYGSIVVRLNDDVRARTTFTMTDSLTPGQEKSIAAMPVEQPSLSAFGSGNYSPTEARPPTYKGTLKEISDFYAEAQIHGGLTTGDIAQVFLDRQGMAEELGYLQRTLQDYERNLARLEQKDPQGAYTARIRDTVATFKERIAMVENDGAKIIAMLDQAGIPNKIVDFSKKF